MTDPRFRLWAKEDQKLLHVSSIHFNSKGIQYVDVVGHVTKQDRTYASKTNRIYRDYELMQYTGLKDKNGVEIYEGDIVEIQQPTSYERGDISFREGAFAFTSREYPNGERAIVFLHSVHYQNNWKVEVIGNIYENPELVK